ncbi:DNA cytosine methyltransferase [Microbacterium sp. 5K110]|nr:DNA cytosine methyltransferase [Microbacterium sp. 5K110]
MLSGELFAGTGMLGRAVGEVFGTRPAWFCEFDAAPSKVLAHHYPDVPNYGDVTKVDFTTVPHTHVRAGGFPCQDVSVSGARAGLRDGTRSGLWSEFARSIAEDRPDWVVIENVGGLLSAEAHSDVEPCPWCLGDEPSEPALRALGAVLADLAALGFDAEWTSIRASDIGAPHGRLRVFILAWPTERTVTTHPGSGRGRGRTTAPGRGEGAGSGSPSYGADTRADRSPDGSELTLLPTPVAQPSGNSPSEHLRKKPGREVVTDLAIIAENGLIGTGGRLLPTPQVADATGGHATRSGARADERLLPGAAVDAAAGWGPYAAAIARWEAVMGRLAPSPVRMDGKGGKARLNPELTEWMMGWPFGWVTASVVGLSRAEQLKACGNGVVLQQAIAALRMLLARPGVPAIEWELAA